MTNEFKKQGIQVLDDANDVKSVIRTILDSRQQEEPFYICDVGDIVSKYNNWKTIMSRVRNFYPVKCNNSRIVLQTLAALGSGFNCESKNEIQKVLSVDVSPDRIVFISPNKKISHIKFAAENHVDILAFDCESELKKIKMYHPKAKLILRIKSYNSTTKHSGLEKFGVDPESEAEAILITARSLGLNVIGVCFHVGYGFNIDNTAHTEAIKKARNIFNVASRLGYNFNLLDIGGGISGNVGISIEKLAMVINESLEEYFPVKSVNIISQSGRYFVTSAFTMVARIICKKIKYAKKEEEVIRVYYSDTNIYKIPCLFKTYFDIISLISKDSIDIQKVYPSIVWGPSCSPYDDMTDDVQHLPEMEVGDWLGFANSGGYTTVITCEFNGFPLPRIHYVIKNENWLLLSDSMPKDIFVHGNNLNVFLMGL